MKTPEWKQFISNIQNNESVPVIVKSAFFAFKKENPDSYLSKINDKGVKIVKQQLKKYIDEKLEKNDFSISTGRALAEASSFSFFANLAQKAAWQVLNSKEKDLSSFDTQYTILIMNYFWVKDYVTHFGSLGNVNFVSTDNFLAKMGYFIEKQAVDKNLEQLIESLSS